MCQGSDISLLKLSYNEKRELFNHCKIRNFYSCEITERSLSFKHLFIDCLSMVLLCLLVSLSVEFSVLSGSLCL